MSAPDPSNPATYIASMNSGVNIAGRMQALVQPGSLMRTLDAKLLDFVSVLDWCAPGADIGAAINAMFAAGINAVYLPSGTYTLTTTIVMTQNHQSIRGAGQSTIINVAVPNGPGISAVFLSDLILSELTFQPTINLTSPVISWQNTFRCFMTHVVMEEGPGLLNGGVVLLAANDTHITDCEFHTNAQYGYGIHIAPFNNSRCEDTYITNVNINGFENGMYIEWSSGLYLSGMDVLSAANQGIYFNPALAYECDGTRASRVLCDSCTGSGWTFGGVGAITETCLTNCWGSTNGSTQGSGSDADGLYISNPNVNNLVIVGFEAHRNTANGIGIEAGTNISIVGGSLFNNGVNGTSSNVFYGLIIDTNAKNVTVGKCIGGTGGINVQATPTQAGLVHVVSTANIIVTECIGVNHKNGNVVVVDTTASTVIVANNLGN